MELPGWFERKVGHPLLMLHDRIYKGTNGWIGRVIPVPGMAPALLLQRGQARGAAA